MSSRIAAHCSEWRMPLFFPIGAAGPALDQVERARQVCQRCSVGEPCLRWALDRGVAFGIWGGATEDERRAMRRALVPPRFAALGRAGREPRVEGGRPGAGQLAQGGGPARDQQQDRGPAAARTHSLARDHGPLPMTRVYSGPA
jgi:WhiB family redox-sensing transcriptional regulator